MRNYFGEGRRAKAMLCGGGRGALRDISARGSFLSNGLDAGVTFLLGRFCDCEGNRNRKDDTQMEFK